MRTSNGRHAWFSYLVLATLTATSAGSVQAQSKQGPYRSFAMSIPLISLTRESVARMELNLGGEASIAVEGTWIRQGEEYTEKDAEETGEQIESKGREVALYVTRYTQPHAMAGFYWTLGAGYRQMEAKWQTPVDSNDPDGQLSLADDEQRYHHDAAVKGMTGHGRLGYRYVGSDWPLMAGGYAGLRHFQNDISDREKDSKTEDGDAISVMTDREKDRLVRHYMTALELGLEFGFVF
jgi:hypothetical protein